MSSTTSPIRGVTEDNFANLGKAFMGANGGIGFVIALRRYPGVPPDDPFHPTVRQWGAWMAYWFRLPYKTKGMRARGYATTPSEWPHEFDVTATVQGDHAAADAFEQRWRHEQESRTFHAGGLIKQPSKAVSMWNASKVEKRAKTPDSHLRPDAAPTIDVSDFPDANWSAQQLREWEARQKDAAA